MHTMPQTLPEICIHAASTLTCPPIVCVCAHTHIFSRCILYVGVVECSPASLPPASFSLTHTQDGWFLQRKRRPARFPRRIFSLCICRCSRVRARLPLHILLFHTPMSANLPRLRLFQRHLRSLGLGLGQGLGLDSHSSSHAPSHAPLLLATLLSHNIPFPLVH
jgi:hypothetical protein